MVLCVIQGMPDELDNYIKRLQEQTSNFERELEECDELITHTDRPRHNGNVAYNPRLILL